MKSSLVPGLFWYLSLVTRAPCWPRGPSWPFYRSFYCSIWLGGSIWPIARALTWPSWLMGHREHPWPRACRTRCQRMRSRCKSCVTVTATTCVTFSSRATKLWRVKTWRTMLTWCRSFIIASGMDRAFLSWLCLVRLSFIMLHSPFKAKKYPRLQQTSWRVCGKGITRFHVSSRARKLQKSTALHILNNSNLETVSFPYKSRMQSFQLGGADNHFRIRMLPRLDPILQFSNDIFD